MDMKVFRVKKRATRNVLIATGLAGLFFVIYQLIMARVLEEDNVKVIAMHRGPSFERNVHARHRVQSDLFPFKIRKGHEGEIDDGDKRRVVNGVFTCVRSGLELTVDQVNDDYCDCPDGSDEFETNACNTGVFKCEHDNRSVHSSRVNDGVCDCCDGSDEYLDVSIVQLPLAVQRKIGQYLPPCPNVCRLSHS